MASDEEGNKGIKRKSEESAEKNVNKHSCPADRGSTPLEAKQVEQAEGNVKKTNWMKCCDVEDCEARPRCDICYQHHLFYIDPSTFKDHCKEKHPDIDTEVHESEWMIFDYFEFVENAQHLKCKRCDESLEVLEFKGPFVKHFDDPHDKIVEQRSKGDNEDAEEVERLTKKFIAYLYTAFSNKDASEEFYDVRINAWWMQHVKRVEKNTVVCGVTRCQNVHPFSVYLEQVDIKDHVHYHDPKLQLRKNVDNWKYFLFDDYLLKCKSCHKLLNYYIVTCFTDHLKGEHNIVAPWQGNNESLIDELDYELRMMKANKHINELMLYLIENYNIKK